MRPHLDEALTRRRLLGLALAGIGGCILPVPTSAEGEKAASGRIFAYSLARGGVLRGTVAIDPESGTWTTILDESSIYQRVSPDGKWLAYSKPADRKPSLWVADVAGEDEPRRIAEAYGPVSWSADGKQVVVGHSELVRGPETFEALRFDADGSNRVKLPIPATERVIDWSADGRWFLTSSARRPEGAISPPIEIKRPIYAMRTDGIDERLLIHGDHDPEHAPVRKGAGITRSHRFSPDGRRVAYCRSVVEGESGLWVVSLEGKDRRCILAGDDDGMPGYGACWSPDGKRLVVAMRV